MSKVNLSRLKSEMETGLVKVRRTATKIAIHGEYRDGSGEKVQFIRKKSGTIEIIWSGSVSVDSEKIETCELGHDHKVKIDRHFVWNYATLAKTDLRALRDFLNESLDISSRRLGE